MSNVPPINVYIGDDWLFQVRVADASGNPIDLTGLQPGGEFWAAFGITPAASLSLGNFRVFNFVPTSGAFTMKIERALTAPINPTPSAAAAFPTRLQVNWLDADGNQTTLGVIPLVTLDPHADDSVVVIPQSIVIANGPGLVVTVTYPYLLTSADTGALDLGTGGIEPVGLGG